MITANIWPSVHVFSSGVLRSHPLANPRSYFKINMNVTLNIMLKIPPIEKLRRREVPKIGRSDVVDLGLETCSALCFILVSSL